MSAAEILFLFLRRGMKRGLHMSQYAALTWLAAHPGENDRATIMSAVGLTPTNAEPLIGRLVKDGLVTQQTLKGPGISYRGKFVHAITPEGLKALGLQPSTPSHRLGAAATA